MWAARSRGGDVEWIRSSLSGRNSAKKVPMLTDGPRTAFLSRPCSLGRPARRDGHRRAWRPRDALATPTPPPPARTAIALTSPVPSVPGIFFKVVPPENTNDRGRGTRTLVVKGPVRARVRVSRPARLGTRSHRRSPHRRRASLERHYRPPGRAFCPWCNRQHEVRRGLPPAVAGAIDEREHGEHRRRAPPPTDAGVSRRAGASSAPEINAMATRARRYRGRVLMSRSRHRRAVP
jgi:hypothetical protein